MFLIFINDLPLVLKDAVTSTDFYADDTTVYDIQSNRVTCRHYNKTYKNRLIYLINCVDKMVDFRFRSGRGNIEKT